jgi:hypothetical protein
VRTIVRALLPLAVLTLASTAVLAESIEEKDLVSGKVRPDPAKGYIFIHAAFRTFGTFLRVPDNTTRAAYQAEWDKDFDKATKKYAAETRRWENDVRIAQQQGKPQPKRPVAPSRDTFSVGSIELRDMESFGPMFVFSKSETRYSYLNSMMPGTYIFYGPTIINGDQGPIGFCYCMGSVSFEVQPGQVTDLGDFLSTAPRPVEPFDVTTQMAFAEARKRSSEGKPETAMPTWTTGTTFGLPHSLKAWPSSRAEFHASGKQNNYFGVFVTRMPPLPGVLDYRRDTVIDVRSGRDLPNPVIQSVAPIKQ